jgi:hypothetical protein
MVCESLYCVALVVPRGTTVGDVNQGGLKAVAAKASPKRLKKGPFLALKGGGRIFLS